MLPLLLLFPLSIHGQVFDKVLVSLGRGAETDSEVIAVGETNCDKPLEYPLLTEGAVGDIVDGQAVICGGKFFGETYAGCYRLEPANNNWYEYSHMGSPRGFAAAVQSEQGYWVTGGRTRGDVGATTSTEILLDGVWSPGVALPTPLSGHCLVQIGQSRTLLIGGDGETSFFLSGTYLYESGHWTVLPSLNIGRSQAACGLVTNNGREWVMVAGGYSASGLQSSTEMLDVSSLTEWMDGPQMPETSFGGTILESNGQTVLVGGGNAHILSYVGSNSEDSPGSWSLATQTLVSQERAFPVVMLVSDEQLSGC